MKSIRAIGSIMTEDKAAHNIGFGASLDRAGLAKIKVYLSIARPQGRFDFAGLRQALHVSGKPTIPLKKAI